MLAHVSTDLGRSKRYPVSHISFRNREAYIPDYKLQNVTFGVDCAPFLAIRAMQQLATDVQLSHPRPNNFIRKNMFIDDVLSGADSSVLLCELQSGLESACFPLRKWNSNHKEQAGSLHLLCVPKSLCKRFGFRISIGTMNFQLNCAEGGAAFSTAIRLLIRSEFQGGFPYIITDSMTPRKMHTELRSMWA